MRSRLIPPNWVEPHWSAGYDRHPLHRSWCTVLKLGCAHSTDGPTNRSFKPAGVWCDGRTLATSVFRIGIKGLQDVPKPGRPRVIGEDKITEIFLAASLAKPKGRSHGNIQEMAKLQGMNQSTISRLWRQHNLKPSDGDLQVQQCPRA